MMIWMRMKSFFFLKDYLLNKGWIDEEKQTRSSYQGIEGISEDEEELDKQDRFETEYNFRFEEGADDQVLGHARFTEGSVRKKSNARKLQRESKQARVALVEFELKEELKQLKNIKKKEIMEKLEKIRSVAGVTSDHGQLLDEEDLDEDFNPEEYDRKMRVAFGDQYYDADDADANFHGYDPDGLEKPDFDAEDELLGLPKGWGGQKMDKTFGAIAKNCKNLQRLAVSGLLTDKAFEYVGLYAKNLETLFVAFTGNSEKGMQYVLKGCPKLQIRDSPFWDAALLSGLDHYESMRSLWMSACNVTIHGCKTLAQEKPRLNVEIIMENGENDIQVGKLYVYRSVSGPRKDAPYFVQTL